MRAFIAGLLIAAVSSSSFRLLNDEPLHINCINKKLDSALNEIEMAADPENVVFGEDLNLNVSGTMGKTVTVTKLQIDTIQSGQKIFTENVAKNDVVEIGNEYGFSYSHGTPQSLTAGTYVTELTLYAGDEVIADVECAFTV